MSISTFCLVALFTFPAWGTILHLLVTIIIDVTENLK